MSILEEGRGEGRKEDGRETGDTGRWKYALEKGVIHCMTEIQW